MIGNEPTLITKAGNPDARLPKGEPIAKAPQTAPETICDPRALLVAATVGCAEDVTAGDWIAAQKWTHPRRVEFIDVSGKGVTLFLADPDGSRTDANGIRRVDEKGWQVRGHWRRYPNLRRVWEAAHGRDV